MHDVLESASTISIVVTLWATAIGLGAAHDARDFRTALKRRALVARIVILDVLIVPLVVLALVRLLSVPTEYALGLLLVGTAAAGPLGLKTSQLAGGDLPLAAALVIGLEVANIIAMPIWAGLLMPGAVALPFADILRTLIVGILVPLLIGLAIHRRLRSRAAVVSRGAAKVSTVGLAVVIATILLLDTSTVVAALGSGAPAVAIGTTIAMLTLGWWFGGPDPGSRRTAAFVSSARANAVALAMAATLFGADARATIAIVVFGLISTLMTSITAVLVGRRREQPTNDFPADSPRVGVSSS